MWVDHPMHLIQYDLRAAIEQMNRASEDEIRGRLMRRLCHVADTRRDLTRREWLKSPGIIERRFAEMKTQGREWFDDLTTGNIGVLGGFLVQLERRHPDDAHMYPSMPPLL